MAESKVVHFGPALAGRANWLDRWMEYSTTLGSPEIWCRWAGIALIAGAIEQKVWARTRKGFLYPNQYIVLVGSPGTGKTVLTSEVYSFWDALRSEDDKAFYLAASSVSAQSLLDEVNDAKRSVTPPGGAAPVEFNTCAVCLNELSTFLADYENIFTSVLQELYDVKPIGERKRTAGRNYRIKRPQLNLLAGCTPSYLASNLPEAAWDQGFLARSTLIYSGAELNTDDVFEIPASQDRLRDALLKEFKHIYTLYGECNFEPARKLIHNWLLEGAPPVPEHPKLLHYNTRRQAHLIKLCIIACVADGDSLIVTPEHFRTALGWLLNAEHYMSEMFKALVVGATRSAIDQVWYEVAKIWAKEQKPIAEQRIIQLLLQVVDAPSVMRVFDAMKRAGILIEKGVQTYEPKGRRPG